MLGLASVLGAQTVKVPAGRAIMVDGDCPSDEWTSSIKIKALRSFTIRFQKTKDFAYVCVESENRSNLMVEMYFSAAQGELYTFHASAKLGERFLKGAKWEPFTTNWDWWNVHGWTASTLRVNSFNGPTFKPTKAMEFQIDRKHFRSKRWFAMFDFISETSPFVFPASGDRLNAETWLELRL